MNKIKCGGERTFAVGHACQGTGQEFERALARLLGLVHFAHVEDVEEAARKGDDESVANGVHQVNAFRKLVG